MIKTIRAPNAPWYDPSDLIWPVKVVKQPYVASKPIKRTHRAKPADIDRNFEAWLSNLEKIK